jgi:hypothetical protein
MATPPEIQPYVRLSHTKLRMEDLKTELLAIILVLKNIFASIIAILESFFPWAQMGTARLAPTNRNYFRGRVK